MAWKESRTTSAKNAKDKSNRLLVELARKYLGGRPIQALVLDGPGMRTTHALLDGIPSHALRSVCIPQWDRVSKQTMCARVRRFSSARLPSIRILHSSLNAVLMRPSIVRRRSPSFAFFDYMGTVRGCKKLKLSPMADVGLFLRNKCSDVAVLGFTFCARGHRLPIRCRDMCQHIMHDFLRPAMRQTKYTQATQT